MAMAFALSGVLIVSGAALTMSHRRSLAVAERASSARDPAKGNMSAPTIRQDVESDGRR